MSQILMRQSPSSGLGRKPISHRSLVALLILAVVSSFLTVLAPSSSAEEACKATYSNLHWKADSSSVADGVYKDRYSSAELEFDWAAEADAKEGDSFHIDLPNQLRTVGTGELKIYDDEQNHVATSQVGVEADSVEFVFTSAVEKKFNVHGTARLTVKWWRGDEDMVKNGFGTESAPGTLAFGGCGSGTLLGHYAPDIPFDVTQRSDLTGVGLETVKVKGREIYRFPWTIHVGSQTGTTEFPVVTTPPPGQKIACSGDYADGDAPVSLEALRNNSATDQPLHYIIDGNGNDVAGKHNLTDVVNEVIPAGDGYIVNCSEDKLTVTFTNGVHPKTGPKVNLITYTDKRPAKDSVVTLNAVVKDTPVSGSVTVDTAGGEAEGEKGGFVLRKAVEGLTNSADKEYTFDWKCTSADDEKSGTVDLWADGSAHVSDLAKGSRCTIAERPAPESGLVHRTEWNVEGATSTGATVSFDIRKPDEEAITVTAKNTYSPAGVIRITKKVNSKTVGKVQSEFDIEASWKDSDTGKTSTKPFKISDGETKELDALPAGTTVKLKEILPKNNGLVSWATPRYSSSNGALNLIDNGDGTASVVVPESTSSEPAVVEVHNTANVPWWWIFALVPFIPPLLGSSSSSGGSSQGTPVVTTTPAQPTTTKPVEPTKEAPQSLKKKLANTGVQLGGIAGIGVLLLLAGFLLVLRRQKN